MRHHWFKAQRGFSIPTAIFVLVVIAMLGAAMARVVGLGQESVAREVISIRALMAAESGAERALREVLVDGAACTGTLASFSDLFTWSLTASGMEGCSAVARCAATSVDIDDTPPDETFFTIRSEGRCGPSNSQSVRVVEVQAY